MPTYDYECDACGHKFEEMQSMTEEPLKKCPECKKKKLRRLIGTGAAIIFKGSGFYQTDYRSESYKNAAKADETKVAAPAADAKTAQPAATDTTVKPTGSDQASPKGPAKNAKSKS